MTSSPIFTGWVFLCAKVRFEITNNTLKNLFVLTKLLYYN